MITQLGRRNTVVLHSTQDGSPESTDVYPVTESNLEESQVFFVPRSSLLMVGKRHLASFERNRYREDEFSRCRKESRKRREITYYGWQVCRGPRPTWKTCCQVGPRDNDETDKFARGVVTGDTSYLLTCLTLL